MTTTAAVLPARYQHVRGPDRERLRQQAAELYAQGCTIASTGRQIGRSYTATRILLLEAGVRLRGPGGSLR